MDYLKKNPDAGDTLEGIAKWWLESEKINKSVEEVAKAIDALIKKGLITRYKGKSGTSLYKIYKKT